MLMEHEVKQVAAAAEEKTEGTHVDMTDEADRMPRRVGGKNKFRG
jgi:hypothetical protein